MNTKLESASPFVESDSSRIIASLIIEMNGFLGQKTVEVLSDLSHTEIHRRQRAGTFPKKEFIGDGQRKGYRAKEIQLWLKNPVTWKENNGAAERT
ncbi:MAG: hypothetical protein CMB80_25900 [Flammeovirgaceae bacterium]|nr:hypothetical protein [Flammeovirgaceae bacterium]MBE62178.1 hypothetical protein [Flammeovirgaceae bacterium]|tara:strand:+ start:3482 stop:3769 length:288 start_codon:yes stop_codon:yes gene_type:complete